VPSHPLRLTLAAAVGLFALTLFGNAIAAPAQSHPFKAEVNLTQDVVTRGRMFSVVTAIRNATEEEQIFYTWACSYASGWTTDNPKVQVNPPNCLANTPQIIRLKPGKAFVRPVMVYVDLPSSDKQRTVTFRLGYGTKAPPLKSRIRPGMPIPDYGSRKYLGSWLPWPYIPPIWSNPVTITVTRDPPHHSESIN
jgi:hypothetical protein